MIQEISVRDCIDIGLSSYHRNDSLEATKQFEQALDLDPNAYEAMNHLGIIALDKGLTEIAEAWWQKSIDIKENGEAYSNLGFYYSKYQKPEKAKFYLKKAYELENHRMDSILQYVYIVVSEGNFNEGVKILEPLLDHEMHFEQVHISLAHVRSEQNLHDKAIQLLEELLKKSPGSLEARHILAQTHWKAKNYELAGVQYEQLIQVISFNLDLIKEYGLLLREHISVEKCIKVMSNALNKESNDWEIHWLLASAFEKNNQLEKALHDYQSGLHLNPHEPILRQKVASLQQQLAENPKGAISHKK